MTAFERTLDRLVGRLIRGCEIIVMAIGIWLMVTLIAGVFFRYVLNSPIIWVPESSAFLIVWLMLAVAPIGFHQNFHISVVIVVEKAQPLKRHLIDSSLGQLVPERLVEQDVIRRSHTHHRL